MDEAEEYKYLRVWMESRLNRNTDMEKGIERAKAAKQRVRWMQRMNGNYGDQARGSYMGKYGTAAVNYASKASWKRTKPQWRKLNVIQEQVGRTVIVASEWSVYVVAGCGHWVGH